MALAQAQSQFTADASELPEPLCEAMRTFGRARDPREGFGALAACFGFDGFSYLVLSDRTAAPTITRHWTTAGPRWSERYESHRYQGLDPRVTRTEGRSVPIVWESSREQPNPKVDTFLVDAGRFLIRSGVAISIFDGRGGRAVVAWDSASSAVDSQRQLAIRSSLGNLVLLAGFVHDSMRTHRTKGIGNVKSVQLTPRERECIGLAANGMTSADIGVKLAITERTVNYHFGNIIAKLRVLNRGEAIAHAVSLQLVSLAH